MDAGEQRVTVFPGDRLPACNAASLKPTATVQCLGGGKLRGVRALWFSLFFPFFSLFFLIYYAAAVSVAAPLPLPCTAAAVEPRPSEETQGLLGGNVDAEPDYI